MNPQLFGPLMDRLHQAGALDVFYAPVQMKKNRPGTLVTVVARPERRERCRGSSSPRRRRFGVRHQEVQRDCLEREVRSIETPVGPIRFKIATPRRPGAERAPEFEDCAKAAGERGLPIKDVQAIAMKAWLDAQASQTLKPEATERRSHEPRPVTTFLPHDRRSTTSTAGRTSGTAYEKIARRRHRALQAAGWRSMSTSSWATTSTRRTSSARRKELGEEPLAYCDRMAASSSTSGGALDISFDDFIRTTEPRHHAACRSSSAGSARHGDIYEGALRGLVLRRRARPSSRRRTSSTGQCPIHRTEAGLDSARRTTSSACRSTRRRCWSSIADAPRVHRARHPAQRDPAPARGRARRHLASAGPGSRGASRARTIRRASSTSGSTRSSTTSSAVGFGTDDDAVWRGGGRPICTSSARTSRASTRSSGRRC